MLGVERFGNYEVRQLGPDKYSVALTNGNMGAFITDEEGLKAFKEKYNRQEDTVEISGKKEKKGGAGKAVASAFVPGLGQLIDGRTKDGLVDMGTAAGLSALSSIVGLAGYQNFVKTVEAAAKTGVSKTPVGFYAALAVCALTGIGAVANWIHSIVDGYRGGKKQ